MITYRDFNLEFFQTKNGFTIKAESIDEIIIVVEEALEQAVKSIKAEIDSLYN